MAYNPTNPFIDQLAGQRTLPVGFGGMPTARSPMVSPFAGGLSQIAQQAQAAQAAQAAGFGTSVFGDQLPDPSSYDWSSPAFAEIQRNLTPGRDPFAGMKEAWASSPARHWGSDASDVAANIAKLEQMAEQFRGKAGILSPNQLALHRYHQKVGMLPYGERTMQAAQQAGYGQSGGAQLYNQIAQDFFNQAGVKEALGENWEKTMQEMMYSPEQVQAIAGPRIAQAHQLQSQAKEMNPSALEKYGPAAAAMALNFFVPGLGAALGSALGASGTAASILGSGLIGAGTGALGGALTDQNILKSALLGGASGAFGGWMGAPGGPLSDIASAAKDYLPDLGGLGDYLPDFGELLSGDSMASVPDDLGFSGPLSMSQDAFNEAMAEAAAAPSDLFFDDWGNGSNLSAGSTLQDIYAPEVDFYSSARTTPYQSTTTDLNPLADLGGGGGPMSYDPSQLTGVEIPSSYWANPGARSLPAEPERGLLGKGLEAIGLGEYGDAAKELLKDPLIGRLVLPGLLTYLGEDAGKDQEAATRAAQEASRRAAFDAGPVSGYVPGSMARTYNPYTGNALAYGQGPSHIEHSFYQPKTAARGGSTRSLESGPLGRMAESGGQADDIPALLSEGEYVIPADVVSDLGDGSNEAGARKLDRLRAGVRKQKGRPKRLPPKAKRPEQYMKKGR